MTAKKNGLDPFEYLTLIFTNAPNMGKPSYISDVKEFLPSSNTLRKKYLLINLKMKSRNTMLGRKTDIPKNIDYTMEMVKSYLSEKMLRCIFEIDFQTEILSRYRKMVRKDKEYAELFYALIPEAGVDLEYGLSDAKFKGLIRRQYNDLIIS